MSRATNEAWGQVMAASPAVYTQKLRDAMEGTARDVAREVVGPVRERVRAIEDFLMARGGFPPVDGGDLQAEQEREGDDTCPACGAEPGVIGYDPSYVGPDAPPCPKCEERAAEREREGFAHWTEDVCVMVHQALEKHFGKEFMEGVPPMNYDTLIRYDLVRRPEQPDPPAYGDSKIEGYGTIRDSTPTEEGGDANENDGPERPGSDQSPDVATGAGAESEQDAPAPDEGSGCICHKDFSCPVHGPGGLAAPSEGEEGEVEPVAYRAWDGANYWRYFTGTQDFGDYRIENLYSRETVQRLQRERDRAQIAAEANAVRVADLQRMEAEIARLRDPANWRVRYKVSGAILPLQTYQPVYVGPPDHESPPVSDNAGSGAGVSDNPPESEGESGHD